MCLLEIYNDVLYSADLQFGFKKNLSCSNAIYAVKSLCDYYVTRGSTVNVVFLDISKAFDKVNHYSLFCKLMNRNTPVEFINVLANWYSRCSYCIRINMTLSHTFRTMSDVCQGGILSPVLFAICKWYNSSVTDSWIGLLHWWSVPMVFYVCWWLSTDVFFFNSLTKMIDVCSRGKCKTWFNI